MQPIPSPAARSQAVADLAQRIRRLEQCQLPETENEAFSSGCPNLDGLLPRSGFMRGALVEWIASVPGAGATTLALTVARAACGEDGFLAVIDSTHTFFPPAATALGLHTKQLLLIRPASRGEAFWAIDQALRCRGVSAVLAWPDAVDHRVFRRWQLAVEQSRALGLLVRPHSALTEPSWAEARLLVEPQPSTDHWRMWRIKLLHARGCLTGNVGKSVEVGIHHETGDFIKEQRPADRVRVVSPLADTAALA